MDKIHEDLALALENAWSVATRTYDDGAVNSECTLQALVYAELRRTLAGMIVLCEPQLRVLDRGVLVPDLVVLSHRVIVAIIELKFVPHDYPHFKHDLDKLRSLAQSTLALPLLIDPKSGRFVEDTAAIDPNCIIAYGAIGKFDSMAVSAEDLKLHVGQVSGRFIPLVHAVGAPTRP